MDAQSKSLWDLLDSASKLITDTAWLERYNKIVRAPADPNLIPNGKALLDRLYALRGKKIITGQHEYLESPYWLTGETLNRTSFEPLLKGIELGGIMNQNASTLASQRQNTINAAKQWDAKKGILTASYHAAFPGTAQDWPNVQRATTQAEFDQVVTPGTALYSALLSDIDKVASYLKQLQDANIPVLWRPYHEMNGNWFWWGKKANFLALWNIMYDRYTNFHGLHNLIWVWSPNANNTWSDPARNYYVGHDRADVLAMDIYNKDFKQVHHDELLSIGSGKLIAVGENGELPNMDVMATTQNQYSWFLTWGKMLLENNTDATIQTVFTHPYALRLNEPPTTGDGLRGQYFNGLDFAVLKGERIDPTLNYSWGTAPIYPGLNTINISAKWTGFIVPEFDELYKFSIFSDDGARLIIDGVTVTERWTSGATWISGTKQLQAGVRYPIEIQFYQSTGNAAIQLYWQCPSLQPAQIIPQASLYSK